MALVLFPPGGIALAWLSHWSQTKKIIATALASLWFITPFLGDPPKEPKNDAKPKAAVTTPSASPTPSRPPSFVGQNLKAAKAAAYDAGYSAISHDASDDDARQWDDNNWKVCFQTVPAKKVATMPALDFGVVRNEWPCPAKDDEPIPHPKMPKAIGQTFAKASVTLKPLAFKAIEATSAYTDVPLPAAVDDWTVCFQEPEAGEEIEYPKTTTASLKVTTPGTACPKTEFTELHPDPTPPSTGDGDADDSSSSSSGDSSSSSRGGSVGTVTPGAYCSTPGSTGLSKKGLVYTCKGPGRERWRP
ncbi:PASTA domain-containing protein [Streptomyces roseifaciens]